jgi:tRNA (guanine-N7-)-methyltransferase
MKHLLMFSTNKRRSSGWFISFKGKWNADFFKNDNPVVLELGCGKGEYSVGLAERYPNKKFHWNWY